MITNSNIQYVYLADYPNHFYMVSPRNIMFVFATPEKTASSVRAYGPDGKIQLSLFHTLPFSLGTVKDCDLCSEEFDGTVDIEYQNHGNIININFGVSEKLRVEFIRIINKIIK